MANQSGWVSNTGSGWFSARTAISFGAGALMMLTASRIAPPFAGRAIGSVFMTAIGFATAVMPLGTAIALFSTLAHALMIVMLLLLPETRGRVIASLESEAPSGAAYPPRTAVGRS